APAITEFEFHAQTRLTAALTLLSEFGVPPSGGSDGSESESESEFGVPPSGGSESEFGVPPSGGSGVPSEFGVPPSGGSESEFGVPPSGGSDSGRPHSKTEGPVPLPGAP